MLEVCGLDLDQQLCETASGSTRTHEGIEIQVFSVHV